MDCRQGGSPFIGMSLPDLEPLRRLGLDINSLELELLKANAAGSAVYRLLRQTEAGPLYPASLILKHIPGSAAGMPREVRFIREILPGLDAPHPRVYFTGQAESGGWLILLEDLGATHRFPEPQHIWSADELHRVLQLYARLHHAGMQALPPAGQRSWLHTYTLERSRLAELPGIAAGLVARGAWPAPLPIERLVDELVSHSETPSEASPPTLLHSDLYPPNIALPLDSAGVAMLIDWDMAGWGAAELDLAYLFLQPFRSGSALTPAESLAIYWQARCLLGDDLPPAQVRQSRQHAANLQLALWLLPVQAQVVEHPYPPGSPPDAYWQAMRPVLYQALADLSAGRSGG